MLDVMPTAPATAYAHSISDRDQRRWEPLSEHLVGVGSRAAEFAGVFGWAALADLAGRLHDIGKCSAEFQAYIRKERPSGGDHSGAGAREARNAGYPKQLEQILAFVIAGHHTGLADASDLHERLKRKVPAYQGWRQHSGPLPPLAALGPSRAPAGSCDKGFWSAFLVRMLFSCLVDADSLETERFYAKAEGRDVDRGEFRDLATLRGRLRAHMADLADKAEETELNALRAEVLRHAIERAATPPGLFTLTVPTGGGKTLTSLSFALDHALRHGMRRIIYVIPFTSIIEQTAEVFRRALDTDEDVLEHHASYDWEAAAGALLRGRPRDDEGGDPAARLHRAAENWDVPIVVTTAVQFFESLFAAKRSRCRKLHNIANSVIVLDEAQTLPLPLLRPCMAALDELTRNYGSSIVLCTATQPALREADGFDRGFKMDEFCELAPNPTELYARLKRVRVEWLREPITDAVIAARFAEQSQMLCIVNSRKHARELFESIRALPGAVHLTTLMCPLHRRTVLEEQRRRLKAGKPVRLVSTSLTEAGVDISFPEVWRAVAGVDSIAQAAGRCNREGGPVPGRVVVFEPAEANAPRSVQEFWQAARGILRKCDDPLSLAAVRSFFKELYWQKGDQAFDAAKLDKQVWPILPHIAERAPDWTFPFDSIARTFRMIDDVMEPVVVPWQADAGDTAGLDLLTRIAASQRPRVADLRRLQLYTVSIPPKARRDWLAEGVLRPAHPALGDAILRFEDLSHYDFLTGVRLDDPTYRSAENNMM